MENTTTSMDALTKAITLAKVNPNKDWRDRANKINTVQAKAVFGKHNELQQIINVYTHKEMSFFGILAKLTIVAIMKTNPKKTWSVSEITTRYNLLCVKSRLLQPYTSMMPHCKSLVRSGLVKQGTHQRDINMQRKNRIVFSLVD